MCRATTRPRTQDLLTCRSVIRPTRRPRDDAVTGDHRRSGGLLAGPGNRDRASTSRYPLVSALSPVAGAPLGAPSRSSYFDADQRKRGFALRGPCAAICGQMDRTTTATWSTPARGRWKRSCAPSSPPPTTQVTRPTSLSSGEVRGFRTCWMRRPPTEGRSCTSPTSLTASSLRSTFAGSSAPGARRTTRHHQRRLEAPTSQSGAMSRQTV